MEKFRDMVRDGKMDEATFNEWMRDTPSKLPDRVKKKPKRARVHKIKVIG